MKQRPPESCCQEKNDPSLSVQTDQSCCCNKSTDTASENVQTSCCASTNQDPVVQTYRKERFINGQHTSAVGPIKKAETRLTSRDWLETMLVRCGIGRSSYAIKPGLYCVGTPNDSSPVLVTANFKLSFDHLRRQLEGVDAWILVLDTKGVNVWCAAGKGTFATEELLYRLKETRVSEVVSHRKLVVPQLGATGVAGFKIKKESGFKVVWGPIQAKDIKAFLAAGMKNNEGMRQVQFNFLDRLVLTPVELKLLIKPATLVFLAMLFLSGINSSGFTWQAVMDRGLHFLVMGVAGILTGAVLTPLLLPWLPFRSFFLKGGLSGLVVGLLLTQMVVVSTAVTDTIALVLFVTALSSYLSMNFTGSTPFTSATGVEKEMRRGIPLQAVVTVIALVLWVMTPFI